MNLRTRVYNIPLQQKRQKFAAHGILLPLQPSCLQCGMHGTHVGTGLPTQSHCTCVRSWLPVYCCAFFRIISPSPSSRLANLLLDSRSCLCLLPRIGAPGGGRMSCKIGCGARFMQRLCTKMPGSEQLLFIH